MSTASYKLLLSALLVLCTLVIAGCGGAASRRIAASTPPPTSGAQAPQAQVSSLQAAILAACDGAVPGTVVLTAGTTVVHRTVTVPSNCTIQGSDAGSTVLLAAGVNNGYVFENADAAGGNKNIVLKNFTIDGNKEHQTPSGLDRSGCVNFKAVTGFRIENLECVNAYHHGIQILDGSSDGRIAQTRVHDNRNGSGIMVGTEQLNSGIHDVQVVDNEIDSIGGANCVFTIGSISGEYGVSNVTVRGNVCRRPGDVGIEIGVGTSDAVVESNQVFTSASGSCGILARGSRNVRVIGNEVAGSASEREDGIFVWGNTPVDATTARQIYVEGNLLHHQGRSGVYIAASTVGDVDGVEVLSNTIRDERGPEVTISENALRVTVADTRRGD